jgi:hypothetical protein
MLLELVSNSGKREERFGLYECMLKKTIDPILHVKKDDALLKDFTFMLG